MSYPGEGTHKMSMYGLKNWSPGEQKLQWQEYVRRESRLEKNHLATRGRLGKPNIVLTEEMLKSNMTIYNNNKEHQEKGAYERLFNQESDYNSKLHRDDRQHTVGLNVHKEEISKPVPLRSSSQYGFLLNRECDPPMRGEYVRVAHVFKGFYRDRGVNIPTSHD
ncbi:C5orf49 [Branchiostoma lanceolatum]|uniref:C5orf49 protein n=1 Tax=Branchiostoma lanceolatum TaxID=7740 RepID=A0A8K0EXI2_BRALA|nr:C5orf49 [Branchiostoma lanceolatum]